VSLHPPQADSRFGAPPWRQLQHRPPEQPAAIIAAQEEISLGLHYDATNVHAREAAMPTTINRVLHLSRAAELSAPAVVADETSALRGRVALISGAAHGIGRSIALGLAQRGATVVVNHLTPSVESETVCDAIRSFGARVQPVLCDVGDADLCNQMVDDVLEEHGQIDILINNAGTRDDTPFHRMSRRQWSSVLMTNLNGAYNLTRAVINPMRQRGYGRIIFMTDPSARIAGPGQANLAASKSALVGLTRCLAEENAAMGITVNCVRPGFIETRRISSLSVSDRERILSRIPMHRFGRPDDVAHLVAFLVSDKAAYITGQEYCIDGGLQA
jgi:3-oxoacyl-[acyl-carrier protein] reductase